MPTRDEIIQKLEERLRQEKAKKARAEAREKAKEKSQNRAKENKQKILLGAFVLAHHHNIDHYQINGVSFKDWLTRNTDRAAFDFPPIETEGKNEQEISKRDN